MKNQSERVRHTIWCDCGGPEDMAVLSYFKDVRWEPTWYAPRLYLEVHLFPYRPWYRRWAKAIRYAFGGRSCYGDFNEIVMRPYEVKDVIRFLQRFLYDIDEARVSRSNEK